MEYGLMLGFNKYVIPFQRSEQKLPFNVAGLDTIKYTNKDFEKKAATAINEAIAATAQEDVPTDSADQQLQMFFLGRNMLVAPLDTDGERNIYRLGETVGFSLLNDFTGDHYIFFGRFATLRPETVVWRVRKFIELLNGRRKSIPTRVRTGVATPEEGELTEMLFDTLQILVVVTSIEDKKQVENSLEDQSGDYSIEVLSIDDVSTEIQSVVP